MKETVLPKRQQWQFPIGRGANHLISDQEPTFAKYPLLKVLLEEKRLPLKGTYTNRDVANIFGVSVRTIQDWSRNGEFKPRNLPGRGRFLSEDLEEFLLNSSKTRRHTARH